jgi:hypothetical protein
MPDARCSGQGFVVGVGSEQTLSGGLASFYLVLRGAAEGAFWGAVTGGSAADGA